MTPASWQTITNMLKWISAPCEAMVNAAPRRSPIKKGAHPGLQVMILLNVRTSRYVAMCTDRIIEHKKELVM